MCLRSDSPSLPHWAGTTMHNTPCSLSIGFAIVAHWPRPTWWAAKAGSGVPCPLGCLLCGTGQRENMRAKAPHGANLDRKTWAVCSCAVPGHTAQVPLTAGSVPAPSVLCMYLLINTPDLGSHVSVLHWERAPSCRCPLCVCLAGLRPRRHARTPERPRPN